MKYLEAKQTLENTEVVNMEPTAHIIDGGFMMHLVLSNVRGTFGHMGRHFLVWWHVHQMVMKSTFYSIDVSEII